jgi:hypothetical protein
MSSKVPVRSVAMAVSFWLATGAGDAQSASWQCRARPSEQCVTQHSRLSSQNGTALKIWLIGTMRMVGLENDIDDLPPLVRKYMDMTSPDHSYIYGDFSICPLEPEVAGHLRRVCVTGAEKLVVRRVDGSGPTFRLVSTWPAAGAGQASANGQNDDGLDRTRANRACSRGLRESSARRGRDAMR